MKPGGILIYYHCGSNAGYAIGRHEPDFFRMAYLLTGDINKIHLGYTSLEAGRPEYIDSNFNNIIEIQPKNANKDHLEKIYNYIKENNIDIAFGFDQPVSCPVYSAMRRGGVKLLVSYWGSPVSSINHGLKLILKKIEVKLTRYRPDHYIFQSTAMANSAIYGRGIDSNNVSVIHNAVNTDIYKPDHCFATYAHDVFLIPKDRKIIFYSGHMERRKGVHVIIDAAYELINVRGRKDVHFLFLGNRDGEEKVFLSKYQGSDSEKYISFGGYRNDIREILSSSYLGVIASTGWDSFTMSSMEIASSGLPLIVSNLQGLAETVINDETGFLIEPGNYTELADKISLLVEDPELKNRMGHSGRQRVIEKFSLDNHIKCLVDTMSSLNAKKF